MKKIDVIVIGGSGILGKQIVKQCLKNNKKILNLDLVNNNKKRKNYYFEEFDLQSKNIETNLNIIFSKYSVPKIFYECSYISREYFSNPSFFNFTTETNNKIISSWLTPVVFLTTMILNLMKKKRIEGSVVLSSSIYGNLAQDLNVYKDTKIQENIPYFITKSSLNIFTKNAAVKYGEYGIRINSVCPGGIYNKDDKNFSNNKFKTNYLKKVPLKRFAYAEDVANLYLFLGSNKSNYITGQNIVIDGGYSIS